MKLNKKLQTICDLVDKNSNIIDVGTDHGYVPIYLSKVKNCHCLATDISEKSLEKAKKNALKANANIKFMCTDGLNNIKLTNEIIIIAGMGTSTILDILKKDITNDLIISTNNDNDSLIKELKNKNYYIFDDILVSEHKKYHVIYFKKQPN